MAGSAVRVPPGWWVAAPTGWQFRWVFVTTLRFLGWEDCWGLATRLGKVRVRPSAEHIKRWRPVGAAFFIPGADGRICRQGAARVVGSSPDGLAVSMGFCDYPAILGVGGLLGICYSIWVGSSPAIGTVPNSRWLVDSSGCNVNMDDSVCVRDRGPHGCGPRAYREVLVAGLNQDPENPCGLDNGYIACRVL